MIVRLTRPTKVMHPAGDIVEVSPDRAAFLLQYGLADPVPEIREQIETPEKRTVTKKTTRGKK